jgi:putative membrane protein
MARRSWRRWAGIFARGMAMGAAEVVPGVSGGTIAFITGIYHELLDTIAGLSLRTLARLRYGLAAFWRAGNLGFLAVLGAGMVVSVLLFARVIRESLESMPLLVWAFFFGLIVGSCIDIARHSVVRVLMKVGPFGVAAGLALSLSGAVSLEATPLWLFVGGMIAVSAWILPGVSGGYMLLLLGLYPSVINAIADLEFGPLTWLALGCVAGLAVFARFLSFLMRRHYLPVMAALTGFMAGSLVKLWPWRSGGPGGADLPVMPWTYQQLGHDPMLLGVIAAILVGLAAVLLLVVARGAGAERSRV